MKFARIKTVEDVLGEGDRGGEMAGWRGWPLQNFFGGKVGMGGMGGMGVIWVQGKGEAIRDAV